ncbi:hypothetical protein CBU02nite_27900 [Clostridium butyricum]|uniref:HK97 gp10 family phage protein n=1 Tax=Clostridium butyricum TaxID=1492 RepID=A0A512TPT0_CLOBU|nr:HK97 gp10 family phage protein [Clostridium butyricum]NOW21745.1 hypothetical protein [Clostridium butyricum]GEQ22284.1 hypothetical protein CBU02nite_27900 [Clostridium butyricum]
MAKLRGLSNLSNEIAKALTEYTDEVTKGIEQEKKDKGKKAVQLLKERSPKGATGDYAKGWATKNVDGKQVIYNKTDYQLTHLLEFGHAKRNGGRVEAKPHIRPVEEQINQEFVDGVKKVLGK